MKNSTIKTKNNQDKTLRVVELFAGVGGFKIGLEKDNYKVIWANQWEPATKTQHNTGGARDFI